MVVGLSGDSLIINLSIYLLLGDLKISPMRNVVFIVLYGMDKCGDG
jgi:hypothetical protein